MNWGNMYLKIETNDESTQVSNIEATVQFEVTNIQNNANKYCPIS